MGESIADEVITINFKNEITVGKCLAQSTTSNIYDGRRKGIIEQNSPTCRS